MMNNDELQNKPADEVGKPEKCPYRKWSLVFACMVPVIALTVSIVTGKLLWNQITPLKSQSVMTATLLNKIQQQLSALQSEVKNQQQNLNQFLNQTKATKRNWIYREALYLVKQATYQIELENLSAAVLLLNDAFDTLDTDPSEGNVEIKNRLAHIIHTLKVAKKVNRDALINQLDQLKTQADSLPLNLAKFSNPPANTLSKNNTSVALKSFKESWEQIKQLIIIRHYEKPVEPLISPLQDVYLKQNLQLQLEKASMAILYRDAALYHSTLQKINVWVNQFFNPRAEATQTFLKAITTLLAVDIAPASPDVAENLKAVLKQLDRGAWSENSQIKIFKRL